MKEKNKEETITKREFKLIFIMFFSLENYLFNLESYISYILVHYPFSINIEYFQKDSIFKK